MSFKRVQPDAPATEQTFFTVSYVEKKFLEISWKDYHMYTKLRNLVSRKLLWSEKLSKYYTKIIFMLEQTTVERGLQYGFILIVQFFTRLDSEVCAKYYVK